MRPRVVLALVVMLFAGLLHGVAQAHKPSDSYLRLTVEGNAIAGQWDIALRDLDFAIGLDSDQNSAITWGEVKAKHQEIAAYALSRLSLGPAGSPCRPAIRQQMIDTHSDGAYAVLYFDAPCATAPGVLAVDYRLFFDIDPQHRGLLSLTSANGTEAAILSAGAASQEFQLAGPSLMAQFLTYLGDGIWHIWTGFDHVLFLLSLLLPAVLLRRDGVSPADLRSSSLGVLKVVTAFTLAHSLTLSLAALGVVSLPSRFVESAIAASVVLAALNNIFPVVNGGRWILAFGFGLIHGFGFASVLLDLGLPRASLLSALVAFNLGVELGQLAIVLVFLPLAFALRRTFFYRRVVLIGGSSAVAVVAAVWLVQRAFNITVFPSFGL